ncbi:class I SAM-dependent methyltransferase [Pseudomonas fluorescens]|uniref:Class I SAM-dependent methyltransferase n=1 Tax=Pseudomonas fluorescens TaxID=294 RepID=A0A944HGB0_PSEFL|nr:class I SAM-dependent methyltransferase [Pseudomonas fluorescens]MBT2295601.1 class I SAM-dependent methyltransferase [Pseudomonas fluorescens]MBT2310499.1 class I SAM-dependent methyltransferase [Pseudomonas fluorescens]MBT2314007.1 class I SAM-dependent methyltransferase [Pseudomonas fluorescens]MBT2318723.1 class I SAM-dependent methyltransferase [Pseudomonas fluorescens]MBT2329499.1 class I SAM-dependent methyltransferase [Pseudomonas fluorescens]
MPANLEDKTVNGATTRAFFNERSAYWSEERKTYFSDDVRSYVVDLGQFQTTDTVMDFGAGSGFLTEALLVSGLQKVVVADISPNMLAEIEKNPRLGDKVEMRIAEENGIPAQEAELDGIVTNMVLHHLTSPAQFFVDAKKCLKPAGKLIVTDLIEHTQFDFQKEQHDRWPGFSIMQIEDWMRNAGFSSYTTGKVGKKCCGSVVGAAGGFDVFYALGVR